MTERNIELRSEKVRSIIGRIPSLLQRIGVMVITGVIAVVLALMYYIPYPQTKDIDVKVENVNGEYFAKGNISVKEAQQLKVGQRVDLSLNTLGGDYSLEGKVYLISELGGRACLSIIISFSSENLHHLSVCPSGEAMVFISDTPILKRVF